MNRMTITEALAELKTIDKRIVKKREFITTYLARQKMLVDPLAKDGGSATAIASEQQAVRDLEQRRVDIRRSIQKANHEATLTVLGDSKPIVDWLNWRKDVAPTRQRFLSEVRAGLGQLRKQAAEKSVAVVAAGNEGSSTNDRDVIVNISETDLHKEIERMEEIIGTLDGQLSLKNATTFVEF